MTKRLIQILLAMGAALATGSATSGELAHFFADVRTYSARFEQVVLDEDSNPIEESSGQLTIKRPGRFRWDYDPPDATRIISNGDKVWIYDVALEQVTVRAYQEALGNTPAALLAGGTNIAEQFKVSDMDEVDGSLHWVRLVPDDEDVGFADIRIGFEDQRLRLMELVDRLGQTTRITMTDGVENQAIPDERFEFTAPPGVDVIDETGR